MRGDVLEQLEGVQARTELLEREAAVDLLESLRECACRLEAGHDLALGHLEHERVAALSRGLELLRDPRQQRLVLERLRRELHEERRLVARALAFGDRADRIRDDPAVDRGHAPGALGDRQELRRQDLALGPGHAQQDLVEVALGPVQADDRLVIKHEAVVRERVVDRFDPAARGFRRGLVLFGWIDDAHAIAALALRAAQRAIGHVEDRRRVRVLLADQRAAQRDREADRLLADLEDALAVRVAQRFGQLLRRIGVAAGQQHAEGVFADAACGLLLADVLAQQGREISEQHVGIAKADRVQHLLEVVGLDQQQRLVLGTVRGGGGGLVDRGQHVLAVVEIGDQVLRAQRVELALERLIGDLAPERDLVAELALVARLGELHRRAEGGAVGALRLEVQALRRFLALGQLLQQRLEIVGVLRSDHVEDRHALDVLELLEPEHLQVGLVRAHVHPFVHECDRISRGVEQRFAATLGLAQAGLEAAHVAAHRERLEFAPDHHLHVLVRVAQHDRARAVAVGADDLVLLHLASARYDGDVATAGRGRCADLRDRQFPAVDVDDHEVGGRLLKRGLEFGLVGRPRRPYRDAAVAQDADDLLGVVDGVVDQQQLDDVVGSGHRMVERPGRVGACGIRGPLDAVCGSGGAGCIRITAARPAVRASGRMRSCSIFTGIGPRFPWTRHRTAAICTARPRPRAPSGAPDSRAGGFEARA